MIGPAASDGPLLVTVIVALPLVPGVSVGVETLDVRSAAEGSVFTVNGAVLFPIDGSFVAVVTLALPPESVLLGDADASTLTGTAIESVAPDARGPTMLQLIGPLGSGPVQPVGNEVISTLAGGE